MTDEFVCSLCMVKNTNRNLFDGQRGFSFKVREELLSMQIDSSYIFVGIVFVSAEDTKALLTNLHEVNIA